MKIRIGCDPGKNGGIVALTEDGKLTMHKTPQVNKEIDINQFKNIIVTIAGDLDDNGNWSNDVLVVIEDVHSIFGAGAKSNFQFGRALGILEGIVASLDIPYLKVAPKKWQEYCFAGVPITYKPGGKKVINKKTGIEEIRKQVDTKAMALQSAKRFFPNTSFKATERSTTDHDGIVDAVLLAKYGMFKY